MTTQHITLLLNIRRKKLTWAQISDADHHGQHPTFDTSTSNKIQ